jgi:O-antigen/teichoic acid export membrane protein
MVLVRAMSKESFANYQLVITLVMISAIFALPGMQNVILQSVARNYPGTYLAASRLSFLWSFVGLALLAAIGAFYVAIDSFELGFAFLVAAVLFPLSNGIVNWQSYRSGKEQFRSNTIHQGLGLVVGNSLIIAFGLLGFTAPWLLVLAFFGTLAVQNSLMTWRLRREIPVDCRPEPNAIDYGMKTSLYSVANTVANYLDRVLLFFLISPETLAIYAVADRFPELIKKNLQALTHAIIPGLSRKEHYTRQLNAKFNRAGGIMCIVILLIAFGVVPWAIPLAYTDAFKESTLYCQILLVSICCGSFATIKFSYIQAKLDQRGFRDITLVMSGSRIVFSLILVPIWGAFGAAIATVAYRLVTLGLVEYHLHRFHSSIVPVASQMSGSVAKSSGELQ